MCKLNNLNVIRIWSIFRNNVLKIDLLLFHLKLHFSQFKSENRITSCVFF